MLVGGPAECSALSKYHSFPPGIFQTILNHHQITAFCRATNTFTLGAFLVAQTVNNPPAMQETWVRSQDQEDSLEKGMATHFDILAWKNPMVRGA